MRERNRAPKALPAHVRITKPEQCWQGGHKAGCRPGRPLCRWMRAVSRKYKPCECDGYHWPHRPGSKLCQQNPDHPKHRWEVMTGTPWDEVA